MRDYAFAIALAVAGALITAGLAVLYGLGEGLIASGVVVAIVSFIALISYAQSNGL